MAFDPFAQYNVSDPYGTSPSQRLSMALSNTAYQRQGVNRDLNTNLFDMSKAYGKQTPQIEAGMARRGLQDSGIRNKALAEAMAVYERQRTQQRQATQDALMQLALQDLSAYGTYSGQRFQSTLGGAQSQAEMAAQIREALG
ncbi:MAG: hypothetical protein CL902_00215 [Dehalococcoidia bacterium]|jgi:hypothetical protein|nr:hypothetical protein [Dehalococcoidia bacterium]|tara:strand:+ start:74 stop:499 length:426 start_codon:yes stop_codon:yes gene_type:complete